MLRCNASSASPSNSNQRRPSSGHYDTHQVLIPVSDAWLSLTACAGSPQESTFSLFVREWRYLRGEPRASSALVAAAVPDVKGQVRVSRTVLV